LKITSFNSSYMSFRNKQHGDANMVWALSDVSESKLYITYLNANESSVVWTNSYITGVQNVSISYASVFEEFMLLYLDTVNSRNWFMRFLESDGAMTYFKCTAHGSTTTYNLMVSSFHLDGGSSAYFGGQLISEHFYVYRTGAEIADESCMFKNAFLYDPSIYNHTLYTLETGNYSIEYLSYVSK
jgi:hypothetical protein